MRLSRWIVTSFACEGLNWRPIGTLVQPPNLERFHMKVAIIEPVGGHGGMNYYDLSLCHALVQASVTPVLFTCPETVVPAGLPFVVREEFRGVFGRDAAWLRGVRFLRATVSALSCAKRTGCEIVHFHIFHPGPLELLNVVIARVRGFRVVATAHDVESFGGSFRGVARMVYGLADKLIAHNNSSRRELVETLGLPADVVDLVPHGNYIGSLGRLVSKGEARAKIGITREGPVLLFFGQIKEVKGLDLLIDAIPTVRARFPGLTLVIAGRSWRQDFSRYMNKIEELDLARSCVIHHRYIPDDDVSTYYCAADVVVLPYRRIYQSGVLLMAMSYGRAVVASDLEGMCEIVAHGETGFLFRAGDPASLADVIIEALSDPETLETVARAGRSHVADAYAWERSGQLTALTYQEALSKQ